METSGFWNIGAVGEPAPTVNAITSDVTPITSPPSSPVRKSCVRARTSTGSRVSASVAELTRMGITLNMTVSASSSASIAIRLLFFKANFPKSFFALYHTRTRVSNGRKSSRGQS